jgi:hypothetical protein
MQRSRRVERRRCRVWGGDPVDGDTVEGGFGGVSGAEGVGGDPFGSESGGAGAVAQHEGDPITVDGVEGDPPGAHAGEQRPGGSAANRYPSREGSDGVGGGVLAVGHADSVAGCFLVGLGPTDGDDQSAGLGVDVGESEGGELGAP